MISLVYLKLGMLAGCRMPMFVVIFRPFGRIRMYMWAVSTFANATLDDMLTKRSAQAVVSAGCLMPMLIFVVSPLIGECMHMRCGRLCLATNAIAVNEHVCRLIDLKLNMLADRAAPVRGFVSHPVGGIYVDMVTAYAVSAKDIIYMLRLVSLKLAMLAACGMPVSVIVLRPLGREGMLMRRRLRIRRLIGLPGSLGVGI